MAHLYKLGLENFRIFKTETNFEFAPITILTGANNSGKSSLIKAIQLLKENLKDIECFSDLNLDFTEADHRLGGFSSTVNNRNKSLKIELPAFMPGDNELFLIKFEYVLEKNSKLDNGSINRITVVKEKEKNNILFDWGVDRSKSDIKYIDINYLINSWLEPAKKLIVEGEMLEKRNSRQSYALLEWEEKDYEAFGLTCSLDKLFSVKSNLSLHKLPVENSIFGFINMLDKFGSKIAEFQNSLVPLNFEGFLKKLVSEGKLSVEEIYNIASDEDKKEAFIDNLKAYLHIDNLTWVKMIEIHNLKIINDQSVNFCHNGQGSILSILEEETISLCSSTPFVEQTISREDIKEGKLRIRTSDSTKDYRKLEASLPKYENTSLLMKIIPELLFRLIQSSGTCFENIEFLKASRSEFQRVYKVGSHGSHFENQIFEFLNYAVPEEARSFLNDWIKKLELEELTISYNKNNLASISFGKRELADLGYGISQILSILLKIITVYSKSKDRIKNRENDKLKLAFPYLNPFLWSSSLIIEEPETNLHPRFQSLLADLFVEANLKFNIQFILETHSEYLIRKLQYLTAKKEITTMDTAIYYFHNPKKVPAGEKQVKKIEIQEDGSLSEEFGRGFFDEALNWKFELLKLKNKN